VHHLLAGQAAAVRVGLRSGGLSVCAQYSVIYVFSACSGLQPGNSGIGRGSCNVCCSLKRLVYWCLHALNYCGCQVPVLLWFAKPRTSLLPHCVHQAIYLRHPNMH
jgi:hypothetical protein